MLQIGKYTAPQDGRPAIIQREFYGQGYIFKDEAAFLSHPDQVCYVPELSDTAYTHNDLLALCDGQEKLAQSYWCLPCKSRLPFPRRHLIRETNIRAESFCFRKSRILSFHGDFFQYL